MHRNVEIRPRLLQQPQPLRCVLLRDAVDIHQTLYQPLAALHILHVGPAELGVRKQHRRQAGCILGVVTHDLIKILPFTATLIVRPHLVAHDARRQPRAQFYDLLLACRGKSLRPLSSRVREQSRSMAVLDGDVDRDRVSSLTIRRVTVEWISIAEQDIVEEGNGTGVELIPHPSFGQLLAVAREGLFPLLDQVLPALRCHRFALANIQEEHRRPSVQRVHGPHQ
mmetsp:Transcript_90841/g.243290  ORF Transcript_90841/g.243290 Transcript_90841/m.243290 type:complete len:225 (+) Transcript_90841:154-828(+)